METLMVSGNTNEMVGWNVETILGISSKNNSIERLQQYEWDNRIAHNGMTYLEIEQLNNTYNNF